MFNFYGLHLYQHWNFLTEITSEKDIDIYTDTTEYHDNSNIKIYIQCEPDSIFPCIEYLKNNYTKYDYILRYDDISLPYNNCLINRCGASWIVDLTNDVSLKKFQISTLCGHKLITTGHRLRRVLYDRQMEFINYPITFFRSSAHWEVLPSINNNPFIEQDTRCKVNLFKDFQFSLVIENCRERNYFTEKIVDCTITKTIPIYYGCVNISDFYDTTGWIILTSDNIVDELKEKLSILTPEYYDKYKDVIEKNYIKALEYADCVKSYVNILTKIPHISKVST